MISVSDRCDLSDIDAYQDGFEAVDCVAHEVNSDLLALSNRIDSLSAGVDIFFLLFASIIMFTMQAGFAMLCAGSVRKKNVQNTLMKNLLDACGCAIAFFVCGYAFAYGDTGIRNPEDANSTRTNTFIGTTHFFLLDFDDYAFWMYQYAFSATSTTIVAGTLAERSQMVAYFSYSVVLSGFVFPVVCHAVWSIDGFLNAFRANRLFDSGMVDFAGSGVVHVTGGITALIATKILGPRSDRFHDERGHLLPTPKMMQGYSLSLQVLGTFLLWFGWYGFNTGSAHSISTEEYAQVAALSALTTTLGAASGAIGALAASAFLAQKRTGEITFDVPYALNGCLSGLVGITASCALIEPWAAVVIGSTSGIIYIIASHALVYWQIDDAVDAIPVHLFNGVWGVVAAGLFASPRRMEAVFGRSDHVGWFYSWGQKSGDANLLAANMLGLLFIMGFVTAIMLPFFFFLQYMGWFRSDPLEEIVGLDLRYNGSVDHGHEPIAHGYLAHPKHLLRVLPEVEEEDNDDLVTSDDDVDNGLAGRSQRQVVNNGNLTIFKEQMDARYNQDENNGQCLVGEKERDHSMRSCP
jgi:Amt family ammonium transporter